MTLMMSRLSSPLRELLLVTDEQRRICALGFADYKRQLTRSLKDRPSPRDLPEIPSPKEISTALRRYFEGDGDALDDLVIEPTGTPFQLQVWAALRRIPAGTTRSYGQLARELGLEDPRAAIDVGAANAANPIALVIPCHRVIAANGELRGYAWGLERKRWLLEHEKALRPLAAEPQTAALF
ncbi:methylated-DNA--[protein]-cysteine S-methyltransferase [Pseudomonas solani]|uniref:methylated-DNA--[protein]-cysteine S-methyltransferase n=1 Tax=Pseudomonas solani TaxID=2731552 RepID=UPI003C2F8AF9